MLACAAVLLGARLTFALEVPALSVRVTDRADLLTPAQARELEQRLADFEKQTGHQFAVLTIPSLDGEVLENYSLRVVEAWRLGDAKRDDGLLLLVARRERKARIEVGYGLEGVITDVLATRVIRNQLAPAFRAGDYAGGIRQVMTTLMAASKGEAVSPTGAGDPSVSDATVGGASGAPAGAFDDVSWAAVGAFLLSNPLYFLVGMWTLYLILRIVFRKGSGRRWYSAGSWGDGEWSSGSSWGSSDSGFSGGGGGFGGGGGSGDW